jgi:hypothetical protein
MKQARMLLATKSQALLEEGIVPGHNIGFCIPKTYGVGALRSSW